MDTPPRTPARMSASEFEGSAHLLSPTSKLRFSGNYQRQSATKISLAFSEGSPYGAPLTGDTPERVLHDRFIPQRDLDGGFNAEVSRFLLDTKENASPRSATLKDIVSPHKAEPYAAMLSRTLFSEETQVGVLPFHRLASLREPLSSFDQSMAVIHSDNRSRNFTSRTFRVIPQTPERILDAPELIDDYYLNLIDWSVSNVLAVALSQTLYLWDATTGNIKQLMTAAERENIITGVSWNHAGTSLAVGMQDASVAIWDPETQAKTREFRDHSGRVGSLSWNGNLLATGSRDTTIHLYDVRSPHTIAIYEGHTQEVCGLRWSPRGTQLASGGNDNILNVWDFNRQSLECTPSLMINQHKAAVKAIAWNPVQHDVLASGGGTADKTLKFWNVSTGEMINSVDTKSQVCGAMWNHSGTEIVTSHGYSDNQLTIWKYPSLRKVCDLTGHNSRVLHLAMSPDGQTVVSAAGDETIRFWKCFADSQTSMSPIAIGPLSPQTPSKASSGGYRAQQAKHSPMIRPRSDDFELESLR